MLSLCWEAVVAAATTALCSAAVLTSDISNVYSNDESELYISSVSSASEYTLKLSEELPPT